MKRVRISVAIMLTIEFAAIGHASAGVIPGPSHHPSHGLVVRARERLGHPPADPPGVVRPPMNEENVQEAVDAQLKARFDAASPTSRWLNAKQAGDAGWGFIVDHFAEIDGNRDGFIGLGDILDFMDVRTGKTPRSKQHDAVQKIE